jgi:hypothetical protein
MSLGAGLGQVAGKVFRIGHLGDFDDLSLVAALAGVELGLGSPASPTKSRRASAPRSPCSPRRAKELAITMTSRNRSAARARGASRARSASTRSPSRSTRPTPACTRSSRSAWLPAKRRRHRRRGRDRPRVRRGGPSARRRRRASRADGRPRPHPRLRAAHERDPRDRPEATHRPRPARRRAGPAQPGAARDGLIFGPDTSTSSRATLGGMIGNNSGGTHSVVYGMTIEHVRSLDVVLSDASTAHFAPLDADRGRAPGRRGHPRGIALPRDPPPRRPRTAR